MGKAKDLTAEDYRRAGAIAVTTAAGIDAARLVIGAAGGCKPGKDELGALLAIGVVGCLFWPAVLNIAMALGLAPVIGVPLPLFSYGGSSLVTTLALTGLLMNVSMRRYVF